jgi:plastocyanin
MSRKAILAIAAACSLAVAFPLRGTAKDNDNKNVVAEHDAVVQFAQAQPQAGGPTTHFLDPEDVTVVEGGTVTFLVNGGGHGVAIYRVAKKTTRADIAADLCQGPAGTAENDRAARATVCNRAANTANQKYQLTDAKGDVVVEVPTNTLPAGVTDNNPNPGNNPRVDDQDRTLLGTSGQNPQTTVRKDGALLAGTNAANNNPGNRIQYRFLKEGRYLVICMNREHSLNDHMFGFVNVVDNDENENEGPDN